MIKDNTYLIVVLFYDRGEVRTTFGDVNVVDIIHETYSVTDQQLTC